MNCLNLLRTTPRTARIALSCAGLLAAMACSTIQAAAAAKLTITADHLLDVRTGRMIPHPEIVVRDGRIVSVKPASAAPAATAAAEAGKRIDLPGMTVSGATGP